MSQQPRTQVSTEGVFMSVPGAFDRVDVGLRHAFKLQFSPVLSARRESDGTTRMAVGAAFAMDRVLLDFGAVRPAAVDFDRAKRDCELLKEALEKHPEVFTQALELFTAGPADMTRIRAAASALEKIGLTEDQAYDNGGGILAALALAALVLLATGCPGINTTASGPSVQPTMPSSPGPADAGADG
jgi:hypothetical protein